MKVEVEKLFHEVADLSPESRSQYFAEHHVDEETRHEVEALLAFDSDASLFLVRDISIAASRTLPLLEATGWRCGPYRLLHLIGRGGMGAVYLAERVDGEVTQRLAVKLMPPGAGGFQLERFLQERQILASLAHPNIAQMLDAGRLDNGQPFLAMEYVDGKPLDVFAAALSVRQKITLFLKVCAAVSYLHRNLIVHRDLKPSNILVTTDGEPKLLDFGIAKILDLATDSTVTSMRMLTPDYASPEQVAGGRISTATDIYSLGAILYQLLTGKPAHEFGDLSPEAITSVVTTREVTRPSKWTPELKGDLEVILLKALRKDPQERYVSVAALAEDLRRYLRHEPIAARPDTLAYRSAKFVRRNRTAVALAALAFVASVSGVVGTVIQARTARAQRDFALQQLSRAQAIADLNSFLLSDAAPSGKPFTVNELLARAEHIIERQHAVGDTNRVALMISIGFQYSTQDEAAKARLVLDRAYQISRGLSDSSTRAEASCALASTLARDGELPRAEALFQEGLRELPDESQFGLDRNFCLLRGSEVARARGDSQEGISRAQAAQRALRQSPLPSATAEISTSTDLAESYRVAGQNREAVSVFEQVARLLSTNGRDDTEAAAVLFNNWAMALYQLGQPLAAEGIFRRAIELSRAGQTEETVSPMVLNNYAKTLLELGRLDQAGDYADRAYVKAQRVGHQAVITQSLFMRAKIYRCQHDFTRAAQTLAEVEPVMRRELPAQHIGFAAIMSERALIAQERGDLQTATVLINQALARTEASVKAGGQGADYIPSFLVYRSGIELQCHHPVDAAVDAARALSILQNAAQPGVFSSTLGRAFLALGRAQQAQQKRGEARAAFQSAAKHLENALGSDHPDSRAARELAENLDTQRQ